MRSALEIKKKDRFPFLGESGLLDLDSVSPAQGPDGLVLYLGIGCPGLHGPKHH
jgi:hypothetical protein